MTWFSQIGPQVSDLAKAVIAVILGVLLSIGILIAISDDPSHQMLLDQQDLMIGNQRVILCLREPPGNLASYRPIPPGTRPRD
jgi:hypothetical protein